MSPVTLEDLLKLRPADLARIDIGLMNVLCATGLPGSEGLSVMREQDKLDGLAKKVAWETDRNLSQFRERPTEFENSEAQFRMLTLATVLQQDLGIRYNPDRITLPGEFEANDAFFADSRDVFVHGLLDDRRMGTCSSLPVLYVAVGRRLGYPLKLAPAKNHLFVRWEDESERFNIDASGLGYNSFSDEHYRQWPLPISDADIERFGFLKSLGPLEELAVFLSLRGHCLMTAGRVEEAVAAHRAALGLNPALEQHAIVLDMARAEAEWRKQPPVALPPDSNRQAAMFFMTPEEREAELAGWRAEVMSRQRRGERPGLRPVTETSGNFP